MQIIMYMVLVDYVTLRDKTCQKKDDDHNFNSFTKLPEFQWNNITI